MCVNKKYQIWIGPSWHHKETTKNTSVWTLRETKVQTPQIIVIYHQMILRYFFLTTALLWLQSDHDNGVNSNQSLKVNTWRTLLVLVPFQLPSSAHQWQHSRYSKNSTKKLTKWWQSDMSAQEPFQTFCNSNKNDLALHTNPRQRKLSVARFDLVVHTIGTCCWSRWMELLWSTIESCIPSVTWSTIFCPTCLTCPAKLDMLPVSRRTNNLVFHKQCRYRCLATINH